MNIVAVIPARYKSSRFPGKPLARIKGKTMIHRVYEQVEKVTSIDKILVATDDVRIQREVQKFGGEVVLTGKCSCGTERVWEAVKGENCDVVINIQGDEPLICPEMIQELVKIMKKQDVVMGTLCKKISDISDIQNPNIVKVVKNKKGYALYFSRYPLPYNRDNFCDIEYFKHIGIYGYSKKFLEKFVAHSQTMLEKAENLEQLRALEIGYPIVIKETKYDSIGVDLPEDIIKIEKELDNE